MKWKYHIVSEKDGRNMGSFTVRSNSINGPKPETVQKHASKCLTFSAVGTYIIHRQLGREWIDEHMRVFVH